MSAPAGFDFNAVDTVRRGLRVKGDADFWRRMAVIEAAVVEIYSDKLKQAVKKNG